MIVCTFFIPYGLQRTVPCLRRPAGLSFAQYKDTAVPLSGTYLYYG